MNGITILIVAIMLIATQTTAKAEQTSHALSSGTLSYQGALMDSAGNPVTGSDDMIFRIYNSLMSTTPSWEEKRSSGNVVTVQRGLFIVMLGNLSPIPSMMWEEAELYLGVKIGGDVEMSPREKLALMPSTVIANAAQLALTVPDGSIINDKLAIDVDFYLIQYGY